MNGVILVAYEVALEPIARVALLSIGSFEDQTFHQYLCLNHMCDFWFLD